MPPKGQQKKSPRKERRRSGISGGSSRSAHGATAKGWTVWPDARVKVTGARCPPRRVSVARTRPEPNDHEGWPRTVSSRGVPVPRRLSVASPFDGVARGAMKPRSGAASISGPRVTGTRRAGRDCENRSLRLSYGAIDGRPEPRNVTPESPDADRPSTDRRLPRRARGRHPRHPHPGRPPLRAGRGRHERPEALPLPRTVPPDPPAPADRAAAPGAPAGAAPPPPAASASFPASRAPFSIPFSGWRRSAASRPPSRDGSCPTRGATTRDLLDRHLWSGVATAIGAFACVLLRSFAKARPDRAVLPAPGHGPAGGHRAER